MWDGGDRELFARWGVGGGGGLVGAGHTWLSDRGPVAVAADIVNGIAGMEGGTVVFAAARSEMTEGSSGARRLSRERRWRGGKFKDRGVGEGWNESKQARFGGFEFHLCALVPWSSAGGTSSSARHLLGTRDEVGRIRPGAWALSKPQWGWYVWLHAPPTPPCPMTSLAGLSTATSRDRPPPQGYVARARLSAQLPPSPRGNKGTAGVSKDPTDATPETFSVQPWGSPNSDRVAAFMIIPPPAGLPRLRKGVSGSVVLGSLIATSSARVVLLGTSDLIC